MEKQIFETARLYIRPVDVDDAEFIFRLLNSPDWLRFIGDRNVHSVEEAASYIQEKMLPQHLRLGFGNYVVLDKMNNTKIGTCGLYDREGLEGVDLGFAFLPEYTGYGYGFESAKELMFRAKNEFGLTQLVAITLTDNHPSRKLLEKLGFTSQGLVNKSGFSEDLLLYSIDSL